MVNSSSLNNLVKRHSRLVKDEDGFFYRDLNKNDKLDIYEDPRQPLEARVEDLISQMTLEEKAGTLFFNGSMINEDGSIDGVSKEGAPGPSLLAKAQMIAHKMNHFNLWMVPHARAVAEWSNNIQRFAEETRLGIPLTIASDPRNHFSNEIFNLQAKEFSQLWGTLGLAAIGMKRCWTSLLAKRARKVNCLYRQWRLYESSRPMSPLIRRIPSIHLVSGCLINPRGAK